MRKSIVLVLAIGVVLVGAVILIEAALLPIYHYTIPNRDNGVPIGTALWMHPAAPVASGGQTWYNLTLTVNQTLRLSDLSFILYTGSTVAQPPSTLTLEVVSSTLPVAEYNLTTQIWAWGGTQELSEGEGLDIEITHGDLVGDTLHAIGQGDFSSSTSVMFP